MTDRDIGTELRERVIEAAGNDTPLRLRGGNTKHFFGRQSVGASLELSAHCGIISHEPTELVLTARGGTPLVQVESALAERGQMLPFEPPHFGPDATIGGAMASGLAGPPRPWAGAPRDLVLGVKLLDGQGRIQNFGGQVMKNVAGYDVPRLMAGAMGTLGILLEISLKVLPRPAREQTLALDVDAPGALDWMERIQRRPLVLTGACHLDNKMYLRLAVSDTCLSNLAREMGAVIEQNDDLWQGLREHELGFFSDPRPLWRLSLPPNAHPNPGEKELIDWGGAQRWIATDRPAGELRQLAERLGGHATLFRTDGDRSDVFHPLPAPVAALHQRVKQLFDPKGILNPGRLYAAW